MLSDHPTDDHRIEDIEARFHNNPSLYGHFNPDISSATPLHLASRFSASKAHVALR